MRTEGLAVSRGEAPSAGRAPGWRRAGFGAALRSELTKIRTVRSTYWTLVALVAVTGIIGAFTCAITGPGQAGPGYDPAYLSLDGLILGQLIVAVLGVLTITSEYSTGMIRPASRPRRWLQPGALMVPWLSVVPSVGASVRISPHLHLSRAHLRRAGLGLDVGHWSAAQRLLADGGGRTEILDLGGDSAAPPAGAPT
jgi:hypothetical protein